MADKLSKVILPVKSGDNIELKEFDIRDAELTDRVIALEEGQAGCVGIKRKCADDGTPVSNTAWTRFGNTKGMSAVYARGNDEIDDPIMKVWPFNQLKPCDLNMDGTVAAYLGDADFVWSGDDISVMLEIPSDMYFARWYARTATDRTGNTEYFQIHRDIQTAFQSKT